MRPPIPSFYALPPAPLSGYCLTPLSSFPLSVNETHKDSCWAFLSPFLPVSLHTPSGSLTSEGQITGTPRTTAGQAQKDLA